jgi:hypothetical protein
MMRRRGAVHGDRESEVIEVGLDELLRTGYKGADDDPAPGPDDDDADPGTDEDDADTSDEWRANEPDLAGASFGVAFFGWLVAGGTAVLLLALVSAVGALIGGDKLADWSESEAGTGRLHVGAWIVLVLSMGIGAFSGGYASGRMVPSHGVRQGLGVWFFSWGAAGLMAGLGYVADRKYDLVSRIDWPSLPIAEADRTAAALVALVALLLVTLLGAVWGGAAGNSCYGRLSQQDHHDEPTTDHRETG